MKVNMVHSAKRGGQLNIRIMGLTLIPDAIDRILDVTLYCTSCILRYITAIGKWSITSTLLSCKGNLCHYPSFLEGRPIPVSFEHEYIKCPTSNMRINFETTVMCWINIFIINVSSNFLLKNSIFSKLCTSINDWKVQL